MYDELHQAMLDAHAAVSWFAFSEAMIVTARVDAVYRAYNKSPTKKAKENLLKVANEVSRFLRGQNTKEAKFASQKLEACLKTIRMER